MCQQVSYTLVFPQTYAEIPIAQDISKKGRVNKDEDKLFVCILEVCAKRASWLTAYCPLFLFTVHLYSIQQRQVLYKPHVRLVICNPSRSRESA